MVGVYRITNKLTGDCYVGQKGSICSVETICDECNRVGRMMSYRSKCATSKDEDIVHTYGMANRRICDKGLLDLAYRSGEIKDIQAHEVHENDEFEYELGLEPKLKHIPAMSNRGPVTMYYAVWHTKTGGYGFEVMSKEDVLGFAQKKSKSYRNGPWQTDFDEMAKKTVLKKALKYAPIATDFVRAVATDEIIKSHLSDSMQDEPDETYTIDAEPQPEDPQQEPGGPFPTDVPDPEK